MRSTPAVGFFFAWICVHNPDLVQAWVRAGDVDRAMHWLSEAERLGVEVSSASLNGVVSALTRARRHSEVELWSSKVRKGERGERSDRRYPQRRQSGFGR